MRRQTTPGPGGLIDKGTKGKRARKVPIIEEVRPMVIERLDSATGPDARLFTGPRGGRISTAVLRDATHWDEVITAGIRAPTPARPAAHRPDVARGCRCPCARAAEDRRTRVNYDNTTLSASEWTVDR